METEEETQDKMDTSWVASLLSLLLHSPHKNPDGHLRISPNSQATATLRQGYRRREIVCLYVPQHAVRTTWGEVSPCSAGASL